MLQTAALLLITGPGLEGVLGAVSLYVAGVSLRSGRHAMVWAAALGTMTLQWAVRAIDPFGSLNSIPIVASNMLGILACAIYAQGFRLRRSDPAMTVPVVTVLAAVMLICLLCLVVFGGNWLALIAPSLRSLFLIVAVGRLFASPMRISLAEIAVAAMLIGMVVLQAVLSWAWTRVIFGNAGPGDIMVTTGFAAGPPSAAVSMFTLLLIASDYAGQRRAIVYTDPLTGIFNRLGWSAISKAIGRRRKRSLSIVIADIDHFKTVNDRFGHSAGDAVLTDFAACLTARIKTGEIVARVGGEEFALLLHGSQDAALARIEEIRLSVAALRLAAFPAIRFTASFGIAEHVRGDSLDVTMGRADVALYRSKRDGRNRSTLADATDH